MKSPWDAPPKCDVCGKFLGETNPVVHVEMVVPQDYWNGIDERHWCQRCWGDDGETDA